MDDYFGSLHVHINTLLMDLVNSWKTGGWEGGRMCAKASDIQMYTLDLSSVTDARSISGGCLL